MFDNILGHEYEKKLLLKMYMDNKIPEFLIFEGPYGVGKAQLAYDFAKLLMFNGEREALKSPDFYLVVSSEGPEIDLGIGIRPVNYDPTKDIKIDSVRALQKELSKKGTFEAGMRVVLILNGENLNLEAQNSFLKTLEEPPDKTVIIMVVSHREKILHTVYSRAKKMLFKPLSLTEFKKYSFDSDIPVTVLYFLSGGSIGKAKIMQNSFVFTSRRQFLNDLIYLNYYELYDYFEEISGEKSLLFEFLDMFSVLLRDMLVLREGGGILNEDLEEELKHGAETLHREKIEAMINLVGKAYKMAKANVQRRYIFLMLISPLFERDIRDKYYPLFDYLFE